MTQLYPLREAANLMGIHVNTLRNYIRDRRIKFIVMPGGHKRISQEAMDEFITPREHGPKLSEHHV